MVRLLIALMLLLTPQALADECDYDAEFKARTGMTYSAWQAKCARTCELEAQAGIRYCDAAARYKGEKCQRHPCEKCKHRPLLLKPGESVTAYMQRCGKKMRGGRRN